MNTITKQSTLAVALAIGVIAAHVSHADDKPAPASPVVTEQRPLGAITAIDLSGPYKVVITAQGPNSLSLTGERDQLAKIETTVSGGTLTVRPVGSRSKWGFHININNDRQHLPTLRISAATLASLKMSGSGDVELGQVSSDRFSIAVAGPGDLRADGTVRELEVRSGGSGDLNLRGLKSTNTKLEMNGPGDVSMANIGGQLNASVSGSGDLEADALTLGKLDLDMRGPGNVKLRGSSAEVRLQLSGSGDFEGCALAAGGSVTAELRGPGNGCVAGSITSFSGQVSGSGDLEVRGLQAKQTRLQLRGPGNVKLSGSTEVLDAEVSGSGDLEADNLAVGRATVRSHGPGNLALSNVSDTLDAELDGSGALSGTMSGKHLQLRMRGPGEARLRGSVELADVHLSGSGGLHARELIATRADVVVQGPGDAVVSVKGKDDAKATLLEVDRKSSHKTSL